MRRLFFPLVLRFVLKDVSQFNVDHLFTDRPRVSNFVRDNLIKRKFGAELTGDNKIKKAAQGVVGNKSAIPKPLATREVLTTKPKQWKW
ncbi:hypothetical protein SOVF_081960 [Spinacia oleracea]|nr:hypothetical protein SOVF_081960 [Spinacia oleracea]